MSVRRDHSQNVAVPIAKRVRLANVHRVEHRFGAPVGEFCGVIVSNMLRHTVFLGCVRGESVEIAATRSYCGTRRNSQSDEGEDALHRPNEN